MMEAVLIRRGKVKNFNSELLDDFPSWNPHARCRSVRFTVQGDKAAPPAVPTGAALEIKTSGGTEILYVGQSVTYGGYDDSGRVEDFDLSFLGAGAKNVLIAQDVQQVNPIYLIDGVEKEVKFCN